MKYSKILIHFFSVTAPSEVSVWGLGEHKIRVQWFSPTLALSYEIRVVDLTNSTTVTQTHVDGAEDALSIGDLEACHVYTVLVVSIDENRNRMKSGRKKVKTAGCKQLPKPPHVVDNIMEKAKQQLSNRIWPVGITGDFKCKELIQNMLNDLFDLDYNDPKVYFWL